MKTRKHLFNDGFTVETLSDQIEDFDEYLLCFKTTSKESKDKMFYWCSRKEYKSTQYIIEFFIAGPYENGKIKTLMLENSKSVKGHREEFLFERN